jgi:2-keto-4-pentenoate hydratase/2-oxohepta-3-ene-1,7-dioic acid hydratase in catechol pathway
VKLITLNHSGSPRLGAIEGNEIWILDPADGWPTTIQQFALAQTTNSLPVLGSLENPGITKLPWPVNPMLAPISQMEKIICIGTNYADHAREMGGVPPEIPVVFNKFPSTISAPGADIRLPSISQAVDFEAELVVVIGKPGKHIAREKAMEHVFGYCCGNDISARDWQKGKPGGQWLLGKTFDTFAPIGPMIVTADEVPDPHILKIESRLNGATMQSSNTDQLIFSIDRLIAHLSQFATLKTGDLIFTGTPAGVGAGRSPQIFLKPGDQLEVEIEGLGVLQNGVIADC